MSASKNSAKSPLLPPAVRTLLKNHVLGPDYELSFAWISLPRMHELNLTHRGKDRATNILSFPYSQTDGEIVMCKELVKPAEAVLLFIHGLLHLKGMRHGSNMESAERSVVNFFTHHGQTNRRRT